jgi:serine protease Do
MRSWLNPVARVGLAGAIALMPLAASGQSVFVGPTLIGPGSTIGVTVTDLTDAAADAPGTPASGVRIERVQDGSPAARAGFQAGDIVVEFDGERVRSTRQFSRVVQETPPNRQVNAVVIRNGARQTIAVTPEVGRAVTAEPLVRLQERVPLLRQQPSPQLRLQPFQRTPGTPRLGVTVIAVEGQLAEHYGVTGGVLVTSVDADAPAARAGLRAGDVITRAGTRDVRGASDLSAAVAATGQGNALDLRVRRDGKDITIQATMPQPERPTRLEDRVRI